MVLAVAKPMPEFAPAMVSRDSKVVMLIVFTCDEHDSGWFVGHYCWQRWKVTQ
jgi:hypothetical protein